MTWQISYMGIYTQIGLFKVLGLHEGRDISKAKWRLDGWSKTAA